MSRADKGRASGWCWESQMAIGKISAMNGRFKGFLMQSKGSLLGNHACGLSGQWKQSHVYSRVLRASLLHLGISTFGFP
jgi:hypothetical protein